MAITREDFKKILRDEITSEFSHIPNDENVIDVHFTRQFTKRMQKLITLQKKNYWRYVNTMSKRVAIACLVVFMLFTTACSIPKIREPIVNFVREIHEKFVQYFFAGDTVQEISYAYQISDVPEEFEQIDISRSEGRIVTVYKNTAGEKIIFTQIATDNTTHYFDNEQGKIFTEEIGGIEVEFYEQKEFITAIWIKDAYFFELIYYGNTTKEQLKNLILSIK